MSTVSMPQSLSTTTVDRPLPGVRGLATGEWRKLRFRSVFWWVLGIAVLVAAAVPIIGYFIERSSKKPVKSFDGFVWPVAIEKGALAATGLGVLIVLVTCLMIGSEYQWGTLRVLVGSGASRTHIILAKLLTFIAFVLLFVFVCMIAGAIAGTVLGLVTGKDTNVHWSYGGTFILHLFTTYGLAVYALLVYAALGFTITILTRSLATGIAIAIAISFLEQLVGTAISLLGRVGEIVADGLPGANVTILGDAMGLKPIVDDWGTLIRALAICTAYIAIFVVASVAVFNRRDIQSGS